jgi:hypothetical protein
MAPFLGKSVRCRDSNRQFSNFCPSSLASDINPELVYQFMHLANNNAIWQSRLGGAFGFSSIATKAGEQVTSGTNVIISEMFSTKKWKMDILTQNSRHYLF